MTTLGQYTLKSLLRHLLINVCTFIVKTAVTLHVTEAQPSINTILLYSSIACTEVIRSLNPLPRPIRKDNT